MKSADRIIIGAAGLCMIAAQVLAAGAPNEPLVRIFTLNPARVPGWRINLEPDFVRDRPAFEREPDLAGKRVVRRWIPTEPPTPLLRNITEGRLYVNADHAPDFTADTVDTYVSQCRDGVHLFFADVQGFSRQGPLRIPYTLDLWTYQQGLNGWLIVKSGWSARFEEGDSRWTLTVIDNLDGKIDGRDRLILERTEPAGEPQARHECPAPSVLFLDGRAFRLDFAFKEAGTDVVLETAMTELPLPLAELQIEADGCRSVALRDDRTIVLLDNPQGVRRVPVGRYRVENCVLRREPNQWLGPVFSESGPEVCVESGRTASLRLGLPLTNNIVVTRDRNLLAFKYRLAGAGGELYDFDDPAHPPAFRIYQGPVRIGKGSFGFG